MKFIRNKNREGFTLIEFMIYTAIVVFLIGTLTLTAVNALNARMKVSAMERVTLSAESAMNNITYAVQNAKAVNSAEGGSLSLDVYPEHDNPTMFSIDNGRLMIKKGTKDAVPITGERVEVTNLSFNNPSTRMVEIAITIEHINPQGILSYEFSGSFRTKENIRVVE